MNPEQWLENGFGQLARRMVFALQATVPPFHPAAADGVTEQSQRQFYDFMTALQHSAFENPALLALPEFPDDRYGEWEVNNRKPELILQMRAINKQMDEFFGFMARLGCAAVLIPDGFVLPKGAMRLAGKQLPLLANFGVTREITPEGTVFRCAAWPQMFPAWKLLSDTIAAQGASAAVAFPRCMFDPAHDYATALYGLRCGDDALFGRFMAFFDQRGYEAQGGIQLPTSSDNGLRLDRSKPIGKKDKLALGAWYDYRKQWPLKHELKVPHFRELLRRWDAMDQRLQALCAQRCKKCDGCGYCVQTAPDKLKKVTVTVEHGGQQLALCPYFPYLVWNRLDENAVADIMAVLAFAEETLAG